jgi:hypothetical protein
MDTYQAIAVTSQHIAPTSGLPVFNWLKESLEARRRRACVKREIQRLRLLEPYLLKDAGIDRELLLGHAACIALQSVV